MHEVLHEVLVKALCVAESACLRLEYQTGLLKYDTISIPYMAINLETYTSISWCCSFTGLNSVTNLP